MQLELPVAVGAVAGAAEVAADNLSFERQLMSSDLQVNMTSKKTTSAKTSQQQKLMNLPNTLASQSQNNQVQNKRFSQLPVLNATSASSPARKARRPSDNSAANKRAKISQDPQQVAAASETTLQSISTSITSSTTATMASASASASGKSCNSKKASPDSFQSQHMTSDENSLVNRRAPTGENICAACQRPIKERYLLMALDKQWHEDCLKCACCDCRLGEVGSSLYTHSDKILCRRDFLRIFGRAGHCAACKKEIPPYEFVMRANSNAYHMDCFACQLCHYRFCVGDRFHLIEAHAIVCTVCHSETAGATPAAPAPAPATATPSQAPETTRPAGEPTQQESGTDAGESSTTTGEMEPGETATTNAPDPPEEDHSPVGAHVLKQQQQAATCAL